MSNKFGIEESKDVLKFSEEVLKDLIKHKSDDGKIDGFEFAKTFISNAPKGVAAISGIQNVDDELKDLSEEEKQELVTMAMEVAKLVVELATGKK